LAENGSAKSYDCFISYAAPDVAFAEALYDCLKAKYRVWFDKARLRDGYNWHEEIESGCEASRVALPVLTPRWKRSEWTRYETYGAEVIIPLLYEGTWDAVKTPPLGRSQGQVLGSVDTDRLIAAIGDLLTHPPAEKAERIAHLRYLANPYFVGREETLNEIHEKLFTNPTAVLTQGRVAAVTALGGVGKTALARQYAEKFWRCYRQMFWVDCRRGLDGEFALIHDLLRPDALFAKLKDADKAIWVRTELNQLGRPLRLLIFDNAEDEESVREWIPKSGNCHTLLTSRFTAWSPGVETCPVWTLDPEAACQLLLRRSGRAADQACGVVAGKLGYLPLALEEAAAYVAEEGPGFGFADYLRLYESHERALLDQRTPGSTEYPDSVFLTWMTTIGKLPPGARAVLRLCSFLAPTPIPADLLVKGAAQLQAQAVAMGIAQTGGADEFEVREWKRDLARYSMIKLTAADSFSIHSLVQTVERHHVPATEQSGMVGKAVELVMAWAPVPAYEYRNWAQWRILEPHARYLWQQQSGNESVSPDADFLNEFAGYLVFAQGAYAQAAPLCERALATRGRVLGEQHPSTLASVNNLAILYSRQGRYTEAEPLYQRALTARERVLGAEHPETLDALNGLAELYVNQGRYGEAEPLLERALAARERVLGVDHSETLASVSGLAELYVNQGRYGEAGPLLERALAARERVQGMEDPSTLASMDHLARLYSRQGRYAEAESLYQRTVAAMERVLGAEHPDTLVSVNNLAVLYARQERYAEAEPFYQRAFAATERVLGADHPSTIASVHNLAMFYAKQGRYAEAEPLYERAMATAQRVLGAEHPSTLVYVNNLGGFYMRQGRYAEAESLLQGALAAGERVLGAEHPTMLVWVHNLAFLYERQGRCGEAEPLYRRAVVGAEKVFGPNHPHTKTLREDWEALRASQRSPHHQG
jgi:tetratricopeptide (TPR) repeat protein